MRGRAAGVTGAVAAVTGRVTLFTLVTFVTAVVAAAAAGFIHVTISESQHPRALRGTAQHQPWTREALQQLQILLPELRHLLPRVRVDAPHQREFLENAGLAATVQLQLEVALRVPRRAPLTLTLLRRRLLRQATGDGSSRRGLAVEQTHSCGKTLRH
jgi:hypothetical protein